MSVELDVRNHLVATAVSAAAATFIGPTRKAGGGVPVEAIFVMTYGGPAPNGFQDGLGQTYRKTDVQIRIRGRINDYQTTVARAEAVWQALNRVQAALTTALLTYVRVEPLQSSYVYIGQNDEEQDECVVNVRLETLSFASRPVTIYFGASSVDIDTLAEMLSLLSPVAATVQTNFVATAGAGQFLYYAVPMQFGTPAFTFNGFTGGFTLYATIGETVVYRSVQTGLGATAMGVSSAN